MSEIRNDAAREKRIVFLDNLRTFMVFLVVVFHAGVVYESSGVGAWFWIVDDPATNDWVGILNLVLDIFIMPTIFFVSGFFTPASVQRKTGAQFLRAKFRRLMIPWVIAVLTLMPVYKVLFLYSRGLPQESWITYFHFSNGILSQSWLWFLPVLFVFDVLYLVLSRAKMNLSRVSLKAALVGIFLVGVVYSISMSMLDARGWTKTALLDFQNERVLIYFMTFMLGALCHELRIFEHAAGKSTLYKVVNWTSWLPITLYVLAVIYSFLNPGQYIISRLVDLTFIIVCFYLSLLSLLYTLVMAFRIHLNRAGTLVRELNQNSYNVYIIHVIVLGLIALPLMDVPIPSVLKYLLLSVTTYIASNLIVQLYRTGIKGRFIRA